MKHRMTDFKGNASKATSEFNRFVSAMEQQYPSFEIKNVTTAAYEDREDNYLVTTIIVHYTLN